MKFKDIKKLLDPVVYRVDSPWKYFFEHYEQLDLDPEYQRDHVWTEKQEIDFVQFCLKGGTSARQIYLNCPGWRSAHQYLRGTSIGDLHTGMGRTA